MSLHDGVAKSFPCVTRPLAYTLPSSSGRQGTKPLVRLLQDILAFATILLQSRYLFQVHSPKGNKGLDPMSDRFPLILLTNDDGIFSEGLVANEKAFAGIGLIYVVAPDRERNANSHTITLAEPVCVTPEGNRRYSATGTPSDCVNIAVHRLLPRKPDLVVSGINKGANLAEDVSYSGTVGAALEATLLGIPAMAVSVAASKGWLFEPAARAAREIALWILENGLPPGTLLNVNVPNQVDGSPLRMRWTRLGRKRYGDFLQEGTDPSGRRCFSYGRDALQYIEDGDTEDTDWMAVRNGFVSVTPLRLDMTDLEFLESRKRLGLKRVPVGQAGARSAPEEDGR